MGNIDHRKLAEIFTDTLHHKSVAEIVRAYSTNKLDVRTSCTCPAWLWWGAQFNATMNDYRYGPIFPKFAPPDIRDKDRNFLACKHIIACIPWLQGTGQHGKFTDEGFTLHTIDVPAEKKKRIMKAPKFKKFNW